MQIWLWMFVFATQTLFFIALTANLYDITIIYAIISGFISASIFTYFAKMRHNKSNSAFYNPIKLIRYVCYLLVEMTKSSVLLLKTVISSKTIHSNTMEYRFANDIFYINKKMLHLFMITVTITPSTICFSFDEKSKIVLIHTAFNNMPPSKLNADLIALERCLMKIFKVS